jgi:hypothetical protein
VLDELDRVEVQLANARLALNGNGKRPGMSDIYATTYYGRDELEMGLHAAARIFRAVADLRELEVELEKFAGRPFMGGWKPHGLHRIADELVEAAREYVTEAQSLEELIASGGVRDEERAS